MKRLFIVFLFSNLFALSQGNMTVYFLPGDNTCQEITFQVAGGAPGDSDGGGFMDGTLTFPSLGSGPFFDALPDWGIGLLGITFNSIQVPNGAPANANTLIGILTDPTQIGFEPTTIPGFGSFSVDCPIDYVIYEVAGCTYDLACNYNPIATVDDNSCVFLEVENICDVCLNGEVVSNDLDNDGVCDSQEVDGCTDSQACNYNPDATSADGSCFYSTLWFSDVDGDGLGDVNEQVSACSQPLGFVDNSNDLCPNDSQNDIDGDGVCFNDEIIGCQYEYFCNYNPEATESCSSCCQLEDCGCLDPLALNHDPLALYDSYNCIYDNDIFYQYHNITSNTIPESFIDMFGLVEGYDVGVWFFNNTNWLDGVDEFGFTYGGVVDNSSILIFLRPPDEIIQDASTLYQKERVFLFPINELNSSQFQIVASSSNLSEFNNQGLNSNLEFNIEEEEFNFPGGGGNCYSSGVLLDDFDEFLAISFTSWSSLDNTFLIDVYWDTDNSELLENYSSYSVNLVQWNLLNVENCPDNVNSIIFTQIYGCTDPSAYNYNYQATINDGSCAYNPGCTDDAALNYSPNYDIDDGLCCFVDGCTDPLAYNYNPNACIDDSSCQEVILGCTNPSALNYSTLNNTDDGSCVDVVTGCTDQYSINFDLLANTDDGSCLIWDYPLVTSCNMTIAITENSLITLDDEYIEEGDWLGAFYLDDNDNEVCGGAVEWSGENTVIFLWLDDETTEDKDGFVDGEQIIWKLWDNDNFIEMTNILELNFTTALTNNFVCDADAIIENLNSYSSVSQDIELQEGWNIFSTYIDPLNKQIDNVLNEISPTIVKDCCGNIYWPDLGINTINEIVVGEGYKIKIDIPSTLSVTGDIVPYNSTISLNDGWDIIGYLHPVPNDISVMMSPIVDGITIIKDCCGNNYWPIFGINTIGEMLPGQGYQIKTNSPLSFSYPDVNSRLSYTDNDINLQSIYNIKNTGNNMVVAILEDSWISPPMLGDEIQVYDNTGLLVGAAPYRPGVTAVTVWGNDVTTDLKDGMYVGEKLNFMLQRSDRNKLENINILSWKEGSEFYTINGISVTGRMSRNIFKAKELIKITDVLGREVMETANESLLYIYDDGSIEKRYLVK